MDQLPYPIDGPRPEVAFYARRGIFTSDAFFKIPSQRGYTDFDDLIQNGLTPTMEEEAANTFLQEWLWFALLACVLNCDINSAEFYNNKNILHTKVLNEKLHQWVERERQAQTGASTITQGRHIKASMALVSARRFLRKHLSFEPRDTDNRPGLRDESKLAERTGNLAHKVVDTTLTLSIAILGEILQRERRRLSRGEDHLEFLRDPDDEVRNWGYSRYCRDLLQSNGWCPSEIRRLESTMPGVCEVYYASFIKPPNPDGHVDCDIWMCKARRPKDSLHMAMCNQKCGGSVGLREEEIAKIIESGQTPLVTWTAAGELECKAYDLREGNVRFGAISHSWADSILHIGQDARGGNDRRILKCAVVKMQNDFNRVINNKCFPASRENVPFWVDVLCFPRQAAAKTLALRQIKDIYNKSGAVLAWDRDLLLRSKTTEAIEMNVRIRLGDWSRRLWTLLEAVLARNLYVAFKNDTLSFQEIQQARDTARDDLFHEYHHIYRAGHPFTEAIWKLRQLEDSATPEYRPQRLWTAVQFHLVDEPENQAIILASLMGLDVTELRRIGGPNEDMQIVAAKRMAKLLDLMDTTPGLGIPAGIIFLPHPKLMIEGVPETNGYAWAPQTWLTRQAHTYPLYMPLRKAGTIGKHGLLVEFPGILLHFPDGPIQERKFWVPVNQSMHEWLKVEAHQDHEQEDWKTFWEQEVCVGTELTIIKGGPDAREQWDVGVLVREKGTMRNGQVRWVEILCRVWVRLETNSDVIKRLVKGFRENSNPMVFGTKLEKQEWCIDGG
ncbi:uncharacterized protein PAC_19011 [Phialocephala subalpina]|uniref:Heterokaryon incompatibility domain-containing protein n=1 Tax=Phialocephala subalpina TaxID=576137 RepID=A0A1L7XVT7_9HELO|nr:uncharacterized protein PAC_19011 [Phialocephala subalpina]